MAKCEWVPIVKTEPAANGVDMRVYLEGRSNPVVIDWDENFTVGRLARLRYGRLELQ